MRCCAFHNDQWYRVEPLLLDKADDVGVTCKDNHPFVEPVLWCYRAGIPWRDLPERFGDFRVIHTRHMRRNRKGSWQRIFNALAEEADNNTP